MQKWVKENPKQDGEYYDIYRDGLKIYTTIDSRLQDIAERAVNTHMSNLQKEFFIQNRLSNNEKDLHFKKNQNTIIKNYISFPEGEKI